MNMQAMLKQAQKLQKDMLEEQNKINEKSFIGKSSIVTVTMKGTKELIDVKIDSDKIEMDDIELLQDMMVVAVNDAINQINKETESKMGKFTNGMPGLF